MLCLWFQVEEEFKRITTAPLVPKFFLNLDKQTDNLIKAFSKKGGRKED